MNLIDLGCGPGLYSSRMARLGHTCSGVDFAATAQVTRYASTAQAYTGGEYEALLTRQGFEDVQFYPSLGGSLGEPREEFFTITARKLSEPT